jgi:hypothetical protein
VWELANDPKLHEVDENLFTFKFVCLEDWKKVMNQGSCLFSKLMIVIVECDGLVKPKDLV